MPLRDHFRPPVSLTSTWEEVHGQWPAMIVMGLNQSLPEGFVAAPKVQLGAFVDVDFTTIENDIDSKHFNLPCNGSTKLCAAPQPSATLEIEFEKESEYEVRIYDVDRNRTLVAAIELVSPANKDRPEHRRAFVSKCIAMLKQEISLVIVDMVTTRTSNLYKAIIEELGGKTVSIAEKPIYAVSIKADMTNGRLKIKQWEYPLEIGKPLPAMPLWLSREQSIRLDLEESYEATCRVLRIR